MNSPMIIGRQTFDGLGRQLTVEVGGHTTRFHYLNGQLPPSANTLADGKRIEFTYEGPLDNQLLSVRPEGEPLQKIDYHTLGMPSSASGALGTESFGFTRSGQPGQDTWTVEGVKHTTQWFYSMNGLLQGFNDAQGRRHERSLDTQGRVKETRVGSLTTHYRYDALSRPSHISVDDPDNARSLITELTYDSMGREHTRKLIARTLQSNGQPITRTVAQTLAYSAFDQIISRHWLDGDRQGEETFKYDLRNRLTHYTADAEVAPDDPFGNPIVDQVFTYNALNGHERVKTTFTDGSIDEALFSYSAKDPARLERVTHTHASWPNEAKLTYDACGRVISDSLGRSMTWNAQDRLTSVIHENGRCEYGYTASGHLTDRVVSGALSRSFFSGDELTHERTGDDSQQYYSGEQGLFAISKLTNGIRRTTLLGTDAQDSVRLEVDSAVRPRHYTAYGAELQREENASTGYAGQRNEPLTGWQILGDYRPYDPVLMCFLSPDSESPFGRGGINPYAYCAADPINRIDPDGHSWVNYAVASMGLAVGIAAMITTMGAAAGAAVGIAAAGWAALTPSAALVLTAAALDVASLATGVASLGMEMAGADQGTANILGWVSLGTGFAAGTVAALARHATARVAINARKGKTGPSKAVDTYGDSHTLFEAERGSHDVVYHERLWQEDLRAFETHGGSDGTLMNAEGFYQSAAKVARREIAPRMTGYADGAPLVLLACRGGSSGAAQSVANVLRRPIVGFKKDIYVGSPWEMNRWASTQRKTGNDTWTNLPYQKVNFLKRFRRQSGPTTDGKPHREPAAFKVYLPQ